MIPDELIKKAKSAYINRCGKVCSHDSLVAALETVAADLWDQGYRAGFSDGPFICACNAWNEGECACGNYGNGETPYPNPYRESETA